MTRLPPLERALLVLIAPLWAICFALSVGATLLEIGYPPVQITRTADYPLLSDFRDGLAGKQSGLRLGDRLVEAGGRDLHGEGQFELAVVFAGTTGGEPVPIVYERDGVRGEAALHASSYAIYWPRLPASLAFAVTAVLLLLRAAPSLLIRTVYACYMSWALLLACTFAGGRGMTAFSIAIEGLSFAFAAPLGVRAAQIFPGTTNGEEDSRRAPLWPWIFALLGPLDVSRFYEFPFSRSIGVAGTLVLGLASAAVTTIAVARNYARASAIQRRQIKWVLFGFYCAMAPPLVLAVLATFRPSLEPWLVVSLGSFVLIPISLVISITRYNLFDVDRLISSAASYTILGVLALAALLAAAPRLAYSLGEPIGMPVETAQLALSLALAAVVVPLQRLLRPLVDRIFFAQRWALELGFESLLRDLAACARPQELAALAGTRLYLLFEPESLVIYARGPESYQPAVVLGQATPSNVEPEGAVVAALREQGGPVAAQRGARGFSSASPERGAIETLGVPVVVPVRDDTDLVAFLCLGPKRSGDVYTSTDLAMLSAVADKVSGEVRRFDQAETIRKGRVKQDALRRYVPGAVAAQIDSGHSLVAGERELSILFVDIRNYTAYSELRAPRDVFAAVNRYTEAVTEIVGEEGGSVLEFSGDGVMAVFGAPQDLPEKERAAVNAARRIVAAVEGLARGGRDSFSVGVGIATGNAYVGNVRSADRFIWTAIGNTTNLASRLQALSRDLGAAIVIDAPTWQRAGDLVGAFDRRERITVRGHSVPLDVYYLPLRAAA